MPPLTLAPPSSSSSYKPPRAFQKLPKGPLPLEVFLKRSIEITSALARLHSGNIVHQSIRPKNILIDEETGDIELTGSTAEYSVVLPHGVGDPMESLPYSSPEQTEGMNRPVDTRSDLYSLGITLYELLSGVLPFNAEDPIGWVRAHVARSPRPIQEVAADVPQPVAEILMKLLAKSAEERYQSAEGLQADLQACIDQLAASGSIAPFPLATQDRRDKLRIPAKLYGREDELVTLFSAFERIVSGGMPELALVSGYAGIGKSALVQEMHKPIARERGFFLSGMFDKYKRDVPYLTIGHAFRDLILQIVSESEARVDEWRRRMLEVLGPNGQLVVEVIPLVELIIGKQPPVPPLPINDAQNRFNTVLRNFIGLFATREHPLAIFLDDLQWADFASLRLLHHLMTHPDMRYFFVLGAYRHNEVSASHPFITTLEEMRTAGVRVTSLSLGPLALAHLIQLVSDSFHCSPESASSMAKLLLAKTGGNPFFATQFLMELDRERLVRWNPGAQRWEWDIPEIEAKNITDNVLELMASKLRRLSGETQAALQLAACIGYEFEAEMLELIHDKTPPETYQDLDEAVRAELMLRKGGQYKFLHDRVHQAAYSLIPEEHRSWVHLRVGRMLLEHTTEDQLEDRVFDIVNQVNFGAQFVTDPDERRTAAELNLLAGTRAKASAAYQSAARHLAKGRLFLSDESWATDYKLTYDIHVELAESEYLCGSFDETERLCAMLIEQSASRVDKTAAYRLLVQLHQVKLENAKALEIGLECLRLFGLEVPREPSQEDVVVELTRVRESLRGRRIEDLLDLPPMSNPDMVAAMNTLTDVWLAAFFTELNLRDVLMCRMVSTSIAHGNTGASALGYASFGVAVWEKFGESQDAFSFGKLAYDLVEKYNAVAWKAQVCNVFASMISIWSRHIRLDLEISRIGYQAALENGNLQYGSFHHIQILIAQLVAGDPLTEVYRSAEKCVDFATKAKIEFIAIAAIPIQRFVQNLRGLTPSSSTFNGDGFDEAAFETKLEPLKSVIPAVPLWYYVMQLEARFIYGDYVRAMESAAIAKPLLQASSTQVIAPEFYYFSALAAAAASGEDHDSQRGMLNEHIEKLRGFSESCSENYLTKYKLVAAEAARLDGKVEDAGRLYEEAIEAARASGFVQNEAIASELSARFHEGRGDKAKASSYMLKARLCYARWGAEGKVRQLDEAHPELLADRAQPA